MKNKNLFGVLQGFFNFGTGIITVGLVVVTIFGIVMNVITVESFAGNIHVDNLEILNAISSPLTILALLVVIAILFVTFRQASKIFKELKEDRLFISDNVVRLKKIALLVGSLSVLSSLPSVAMNYVGVSSELYLFDFGYFFTGLIIFAFSKVWERANEIAEENEFTI
jgi:Protein of unknown function (DUF2975).